MLRNLLLLNCLDLDVDAGWKIELHQSIHRLLCGLEYVDQTLVRADLEGLARLLVDVWRTQNAVLVLHRRQRNGPCNLRAGTLCRLNDLSSGGVKHAVVVSLQANPDSLSCHRLLSFLYAKNLFESPPAKAGGAGVYLMISEMVP